MLFLERLCAFLGATCALLGATCALLGAFSVIAMLSIDLVVVIIFGHVVGAVVVEVIVDNSSPVHFFGRFNSDLTTRG